MKLPDIQAEILSIAIELRHNRLEKLARQMSRRKPSKIAPRSSEPITEKKQAQIREYVRLNPTMTQHEVAREFKCSQGRISEALRGYRT